MEVPSHLKALQALELAVRTGSFAAAAELLAITPAAVGQRVKTLEDYLGVALLERGRSGIRPTPALLRALPDLATGFAALESATAALDMQRARDLHIAADPDVVELWLKPRLGAFRARHPSIRFCINGEGDAPARLARIDCEIRFAPPDDRNEQDLLFRDFILPVAAPGMIDRIANVAVAARLEGFPLIHTEFYREDPDALNWPRWFLENGLDRQAPERGIRFPRIAAVLKAVTADAGVALCGVALLSDVIARRTVLPVYPVSMGRATSHGFYARYGRRASPDRLVETFRAWLREEARATFSMIEALALGDDDAWGR